MLTDIVRQCQSKVPNRFELVVLAAERSRQILIGARPTVDNPTRERASKLALREIDTGIFLPDGDQQWKVERPGLADLFHEAEPEAPKAAAEPGWDDDDPEKTEEEDEDADDEDDDDDDLDDEEE